MPLGQAYAGMISPPPPPGLLTSRIATGAPGAPAAPTGLSNNVYEQGAPGAALNLPASAIPAGPLPISWHGLANESNEGVNQVGQYGTIAASTPGQLAAVYGQQGQEKYQIGNTEEYGDYQGFGQQATSLGQAAGQYLNTPGVSAAIAQQQKLAAGQNAVTSLGQSDQAQAANLLGATAQGRGPNLAGMQSQQAVAQGLRANLAAAASARGGAYAQSAAQTQAGQQNAALQGAAAQTAAQTAAAQQLSAEQGYAQAGTQLAGTGLTSQSTQLGAAQALEAAQAQQQQTGLGYYQSQQQAAQGQSGLAAQLAQAQTANDYGLAGTQLQTQTQQNIANQQQNTQLLGAGLSAGGAVLGTLLAPGVGTVAGGAAGGAVAQALSTGGAAAGARGARDAGAPPDLAAGIGAHVGQSIGVARGGPSLPAPVWEGAQAADAQSAALAARQPPGASGMTPEEAHAILAKLRAGRTRKPAPTAQPSRAPDLHTGEPLEHQAYRAGMGLARAMAGMGG